MGRARQEQCYKDEGLRLAIATVQRMVASHCKLQADLDGVGRNGIVEVGEPPHIVDTDKLEDVLYADAVFHIGCGGLRARHGALRLPLFRPARPQGGVCHLARRAQGMEDHNERQRLPASHLSLFLRRR